VVGLTKDFSETTLGSWISNVGLQRFARRDAAAHVVGLVDDAVEW